SVEAIGSKLLASGLSSRINATQFLALKGAIALVGLLFVIVFGAAASPLAGFLLAPVFAVGGYLTPDLFLRFKIRARRAAIRVQRADSRLRRQAAAEEKAMKAPIKMLFPTVLFIFPSMFVVIIGPAVMNIMHSLK